MEHFVEAGLCVVEVYVTKNALNSNFHRMFEEIPQKYYQKFWVFVFAVVEQSGRDTIPVSIETEVDDLVVQPSLQECQWGHVKPWWRYFVQLGEKWLLIESDY